jgi:hypothetical protein
VKKVEFISDRMSYMALRGSQYDTFLSIHALRGENIYNITDSLYEEVQHVFYNLPKFNCQVGRKDISKPTTGNESLHESNNDIGNGVEHFVKSITL